MQSRDIRAAILTLQKQGRGLNATARAVNVSRNTVRRVLASGSADVPEIERVEKAAPYESAIRDLYTRCEGNLVRVHEELAALGVVLPYSTLSGFCRRHGIGQKPKERAGQYDFKPGEEMQHDTSPHDVVLSGRLRRLQNASLVLCYARMIFSQVYPVWNRFWAKVFLMDAMVYFEGAAEHCMVDNSSILIARGNGKNAVFAPEVVAFGERFGTTFIAHEVVEREIARAQKAKPSYAEFHARILREQEKLMRERSLESRIEKAGLPERWTLETFPFDMQTGLSAAAMRQYGDLDFVAKKENLVFIGPTGVGKTGLASGICSRRSRMGIVGFSSKRRTSSTTCTPALPTARRESSSTGSRKWICS